MGNQLMKNYIISNQISNEIVANNLILTCNEFDNHSIDSSKPSPRMALALNIWKVRFFNASRPNA